MNKIIYGALALSVAGNAFLLLKSDDKPQVAQAAKEVLVTEKEIVTLEVEDKELSAKYQKALAEIEKYKLLLKDEKELAKSQIEELTKAKEKVEFAAISKEIKETTGEEIDIEKMLEEKKDRYELFDKEPVDESWAYRTQDDINKTLHEEGDLSLYSIDDLVCKSSLCKVTINPYSKSKGAGMAAGMNASFSFHSGESGASQYLTSFHMNSENEEVELIVWEKPKE